MNLQQFFTQTLSNSGASYSILTGELNPNNGYFVSLPNHEQQTPLNEFNQDTVQNFIYQNADLLNRPNHFLGSRVENGIVYLDISEQIQDRRTALQLGYNRNKLAIFDANVGEVINLPTPQRTGTFTQQKAYLTQVIDRLCLTN